MEAKIEKTENDKDYLYKIRVINTENQIAFFANLKLKDDKGEIIQPVFWSDNYISLLPNQEKVIECRISKSLAKKSKLKVEVKGWNVLFQDIAL